MLTLVTDAQPLGRKKIKLTDLTGSVSSTSWDTTGVSPSVNPAISDVQDVGDTPGVVILLTLSTGEVLTWDDTAAIKLLGFPNINQNSIYLLNTHFGKSADFYFPDGLTTLVADANGQYFMIGGADALVPDAFYSTSTVKYYNLEGVKCCLENLCKALDQVFRTKSERTVGQKRFDEALDLYNQLVILVRNKSYNLADEALAMLQTMCANAGCTCC